LDLECPPKAHDVRAPSYWETKEPLGVGLTEVTDRAMPLLQPLQLVHSLLLLSSPFLLFSPPLPCLWKDRGSKVCGSLGGIQGELKQRPLCFETPWGYPLALLLVWCPTCQALHG
jgi:hypothetical protein